MTLPEAAARLGLSRFTLAHAARRGTLEASAVGGVWIVDEEALERYGSAAAVSRAARRAARPRRRTGGPGNERGRQRRTMPPGRRHRRERGNPPLPPAQRRSGALSGVHRDPKARGWRPARSGWPQRGSRRSGSSSAPTARSTRRPTTAPRVGSTNGGWWRGGKRATASPTSPRPRPGCSPPPPIRAGHRSATPLAAHLERMCGRDEDLLSRSRRSRAIVGFALPRAAHGGSSRESHPYGMANGRWPAGTGNSTRRRAASLSGAGGMAAEGPPSPRPAGATATRSQGHTGEAYAAHTLSRARSIRASPLATGVVASLAAARDAVRPTAIPSAVRATCACRTRWGTSRPARRCPSPRAPAPPSSRSRRPCRTTAR